MSDLPEQLRRVYVYWDTCRRGADVPAWKNFDLLGLPAQLLRTTMVVDIAEPMSESRFRYWGSGMTEIHGKDKTGTCPYELQPVELAEQIIRDHQEVIAARAPTAGTYEFTSVRGLTEVHSLLRLPLSDDGVRIDKIVICGHPSIFEDRVV